MKYNGFQLRMVLLVVAVSFCANIQAVGPSVQHIFQGGDPASASQVNENFQELADRIQDNTDLVQSYDYRDYLSPASVSSKTFEMTELNGSCTQETRSYVRAAQGADTLLTMTRVRSGTNCASTLELNFLLSSAGMYKQSQVDAFTRVDYESGVVLRTSAMKVGHTWGSAVRVFATDTTGAIPGTEYVGNELDQYTLLAVEDVVLPYDGTTGALADTSYSGCLKISRHRNTTGLQHVSWYCPGVGLVKRMGTGRTFELRSRVTQ